MKRNKIKYDRWLRMLFLSFALLTGGAGWLGGQTADTNSRQIKLEYSTDNDYHKHDSVFVETKVIYVIPGEKRELFIPEMRININHNVNNHRYNWYIHWYVKSENISKGVIEFKSFETTKDKAMLQGGEWTFGDTKDYVTTNHFVNVQDGDGGLVWSKRLKEYFGDNSGYGMDASTITYTTADEFYKEGDTLYCDVSIYQDGAIQPQKYNGSIGIYTEPTLTKRTKYIIKHYQECIEKYVDVKEEDKKIEFDYPAIRNAMNYDGTGSLTENNLNRTINFSMSSLPNNYFWIGENGQPTQGEYFQYQIEHIMDEYENFHLTTRGTDTDPISLDLQQTQRIPRNMYDGVRGKDITVHVRAVNNKGEKSKDLAIFVFHPLEGVGFEIEKNIKDNDDRYPRRDKERYELIGSVDFDLGDPIVNWDRREEENIASEPFGFFGENQTTYGFWNKNIFPLLRTQWNGTTPYYFATSNQNMYGLFRSANSSFHTANNGYIVKNEGGYNWQYRYYFPVLVSADNDKFTEDFYDRTFYISQDKDDPDNKNKIEGDVELEKRYGHFYYVDASNEPGTVVEVPINGTLCLNTEIIVTAWLADMTRANWVGGGKDYPLAPNLNIFFKGKNGKEEVVLHRFTTGDALVNYSENGKPVSVGTPKYNSYLMKWQQLYYSFVVESDETYDTYCLEIQNNEPHTDGADYAIDDIRIFKTKPQVDLVKAGDLCETDINTLRFVTDYNRALDVLGLKKGEKVPENQRVKKEDLPQLLQDYLEGKPEDAIDYFTSIYYSVYKESDKSKPIQINYTNLRSSGKQNYRTSYISTKLEDMVWTQTFDYELSKDLPNPKIASAPVYLDIENRELEPGVYYIARLSTHPLTESELNIENDRCALIGEPFQLTISNSNYEITNGETKVIKPEDAVVGETYTIAGKFWYKKSIDAEGFLELKEAKFDWFLGTLEEFEAENMIKLPNGGSYSVEKALSELTKDDGIANKDEIRRLLDEKYGIKDDNNEEKEWRLILGKSSFEYTMNLGYQSVVIRAQENQKVDGQPIKETLYCSNPVQFDLGGTPPTVTPGDPEVPDPDPTDPENPDPQPDKDPDTGSHVRSVRVGLIQIQKMKENQGTLRIPIHFRKSKKDEVFAVNTENTKITVCSTSDKERKDDLMNQQVATLVDFGDEYVNIAENGAKPQWDKHFFKIQFNENTVKSFREGFWYMVDIPYAVIDKDKKIVYENSFKLTLKIVPEYVTWIGKTDGTEVYHNWNNDDLNHWRRSTNAELYISGEKEAEANGTHNEAYTPMRFTKVTIHGKATLDEKVGAAYAAYPHLYMLKKNTGAQKKDPNNVLLNMDPGNLSDEIGAATKNIEYDLLADPEFEVELKQKPVNTLSEHSYACVRFYGNTCDEIYIKPESEILHTEYLTYNKAHVDYEMDPNRWYMLASPLKGVVSGDMYLPTGENNTGKYARQETPAFNKIEYLNNTDYTRWNPAVYMRGWNNSSVTVVYPKDKPVEYAVKGNWSNLYNDVNVSFAPGHGFSIGTKVSTEFLNRKEKVLFRLPKEDSKYYYYSNDGNIKDYYIDISTNRTGKNGRFYFSPDEKESLTVQTTGMFGNPFMSHLDMSEFIKENGSGSIYYILNGNTMITNIVGAEYNLSTDSDYDPNYVAPLQSFIKNDLKNAVFTTAMIAKAPTSGKKVGLRSATAAASEKTLPQLRITASRGGVHNTALVAGLVTASDSYIEGEDAALLINEEVAAPQVYTLAGNQMTAINVTPELKDIPVGIYGKDASPVELSFKLSGDMQNVTLVDKQSGKVYPVTDGLTMTVSGNTSGRYFLNGSIATSNEVIARNEIVCYANGNGQIVVSSVDPLTRISVYSVSGQRLRYLDNLNMQTVYVKDLAPGIYIVKAESVTQVCSEKMEVK
ncbi:T9SS type A sorting domain-containing protein [Parabacteroides goldsteinii]|uniref:T9SS type A sorting domain-containing protein n=1 Tax=Parabacteroides goldsteinii TaxID=328812 RepID=A0A6G1Z8F1_9BACT|nr:T9SS type A sorting domain-containing protein [Parabacteroides goldsteinii]MRX96752.1 T9SS type A sorting domain-containing protein [Parabacteroides goldsteinii]MRY00677.1 T9SS type A sorting domain-containing protein [Parabacteroides goldsteinii]MRY10236.1 T9SS type A sorting domain-containing protein [Parabacteroides goldsteinii]MRY20086.1 T9SS type A sorting domain-containing protein [Parabacteroides goldsteinii]